MKLTPEKLEAFCVTLANTCNVGLSAETIGISRYTAYLWRKGNPAFAEAWDDALRAGILRLEDEAHRRAFDGVDEPQFYQGSECGAVRKYSDTLAIFLLKAHNPDKYRERSSLDLNGSLSLNSLTTDELRAELAAITASTGVLQPDATSDSQIEDDDVGDLV